MSVPTLDDEWVPATRGPQFDCFVTDEEILECLASLPSELGPYQLVRRTFDDDTKTWHGRAVDLPTSADALRLGSWHLRSTVVTPDFPVEPNGTLDRRASLAGMPHLEPGGMTSERVRSYATVSIQRTARNLRTGEVVQHRDYERVYRFLVEQLDQRLAWTTISAGDDGTTRRFLPMTPAARAAHFSGETYHAAPHLPRVQGDRIGDLIAAPKLSAPDRRRLRDGLAAHVDAALRSRGFDRGPRSIDYRRRLPDSVQSISLVAYPRPPFRPDAWMFVRPEWSVTYPGIDRELARIMGSKPDTPTIGGTYELVTPADDPPPMLYLQSPDSMASDLEALRAVLLGSIVPFLDRVATPADLVDRYVESRPTQPAMWRGVRALVGAPAYAAVGVAAMLVGRPAVGRLLRDTDLNSAWTFTQFRPLLKRMKEAYSAAAVVNSA